MLKQTLKWVDTFLAVILALVLGVMLLAFAYVSWQPRNIADQVPQLLAKLDIDVLKEGYDLKFDEVVIRGGDFNMPLLLQVKGLKLKNPKGNVLLNMPEMRIEPSFRALLQGKVFPGSVEIIGADFAILEDVSGAFFLDTREQAEPLPLDEIFFEEEANGDEAPQKAENDLDDEFSLEELFALGLNRLHINRASVEFKSERTGFHLNFPNFSVRIDSVLFSQQVRGMINTSHINIEDNPAVIQSGFVYDHGSGGLQMDLHAHHITLAQYAPLSEQLKIFSKLTMPLSGKINAQMNLSGEINAIRFDLESPKLANLKAKGGMRGSFTQPVIDAKLSLGKFDLPWLKKQWPDGMGRDALRWINRSLKSATVEKASAEIHLTPEILAMPELPKKAINTVLHITGAEIDYTPGFPPVKNASGRVYFEGQSLRAEIDQVEMLKSTKLNPPAERSFATLLIPDLLVDNIDILLDIPLTASLQDVVAFIEATPYKLPPSVPIKKSNIAGKLGGTLKMHIVDQISPIEDDVDFSVEGSLKKVSYSGIVEGIDITALNGSVKADNSSAELQTKGQLNGKPFALDVAVGGKDDRYHYDGHLPVAVLGLVDKRVASHFSGAIKLDAIYRGSGSLSLAADTTALAYRFPTLKLMKKAGQNGEVSAEGKMKKDQLALSKLRIHDSAIKGSGAVTVNTNTGTVSSATVNALTFGKSRLSGNYSKQKGKHQLKLNSSYFDLSPFMGDTKKVNSSSNEKTPTVLQRLADIPDIKLDVSIDRLYFGPDRELQNTILKADCYAKRCQEFNLSTRSGETPFTAKIGSIDGKRNFTASTPDLGRILRVTGAFNDLRNGKLDLNAVYQDGMPNRPMAGRMVLEDFNIRNVPVLTKLLTLATFTGILDALSGGGLSFQKMVVPFQYDTQKLSIQDAKAAGPSVGLTASGGLDVPSNELRVEGAVIPAKLLDTLLSGIPLIGNVYDAITGGEGLVAVNYKMKGKADDPKISVNPLSVLTPGFLRGVFDQPSKSQKKEAKETKEILESVEEQVKEMEKTVEKEQVEEQQAPDAKEAKPERPKPGSFLRKKR